MITININGKEINTSLDKTIKEVAQENDIKIPTFCYQKTLKPFSSCYLCVVEIDGFKNLALSCSTYVADGMKILTESEKVILTSFLESSEFNKIELIDEVSLINSNYNIIINYNNEYTIITNRKNKKTLLINHSLFSNNYLRKIIEIIIDFIKDDKDLKTIFVYGNNNNLIDLTKKVEQKTNIKVYYPNDFKTFILGFSTK